jgi:hypothetical protein
MGSAKILNLFDRTATDSGDGIDSPKNSAKIALYSFFDVWHYEDNRRYEDHRRSYEVEAFLRGRVAKVD